MNDRTYLDEAIEAAETAKAAAEETAHYTYSWQRALMWAEVSRAYSDLHAIVMFEAAQRAAAEVG
jgi:hypothetical protein